MCVVQFWTLGKSRELSSCADPKVSAYDSAENIQSPCKTYVLYKKSFFRFGPFSGHAPAWEIIISATCWRCECASRSQKKHFNKHHLHRNAENPLGHCKTNVLCCHSIIYFETAIIKLKIALLFFPDVVMLSSLVRAQRLYIIDLGCSGRP